MHVYVFTYVRFHKYAICTHIFVLLSAGPARVELYDFGAPLESASPSSNALLFEAQNIAATYPGQRAGLIRRDVSMTSRSVVPSLGSLGWVVSGVMQTDARR